MLFTRYMLRAAYAISRSYWMLPVIGILAIALLVAGLRHARSSSPPIPKGDKVVTEFEWT